MEIIFEDKDIAVVIKPVGADSERDIPKILSEKLGGDFYCVHRLDKAVGGVMVYARNKKSAATLSRLIQQGDMIKEYVATVHGVPDDSGIFEDLLFKDSRKNKAFVVSRERKGVKYAKLEYDKISENNNCSLVHIRLYTGRSHQIRVQFASRGFPLLGDRKYGAKDDLKAPLLFSSKLTFPYNNEIKSFSALPDWANKKSV